MKLSPFLAPLVLVVAIIIASATPPTGTPIARTFRADPARTRDAVRAALPSLGFALTQEGADGSTVRYLKGERKAHGWSCGEVLHVSIVERSDGTTFVEAITTRRFGDNILAGDYSAPLLQNTATRLGE